MVGVRGLRDRAGQADAAGVARAPGRAGRGREAARNAGPRRPGMTPAIIATGVRKSFGETLVLDGVDVAVDEGAIFALLGPNGAGKTTIVRILTTLLPADAGELRVAGHDLRENPDGVRHAIGVTGQFSALDD